MTTIAWDGSTLASDSQSTAGDAICSLREQKIFLPPEGEEWMVNGERVIAVGFSGDCGVEYEALNLMRDNLHYATSLLPDSSFGALAVVGRDHAYLISKDSGKVNASISLQVDPYAMGSGGMIARAAMRCGKSAIEAVHVAIEMDVYSGGTVNHFTIAQAPFHIVQNSESK